MKGFQYITCPELRKGPLIKVHTGYMKICHIVSNKCLAVTTTENKSEVHILLINEDKVDIAERISLRHHNVSIAATPINFVVIDGSKNKMVFYSTCGEELFQKYLPFYGYPHHIYSDNVYFYVLFRRHSILRCYDLYGEMNWQWELPFPVHPHIAVFQGTLYVPDTQLNRVLLYKYQDRSSGCCLPIKNPYFRNLNLRLKEKENDQKLVIGKICNLSNGQLVVSDIKHDCLLYISQGDIVSRLSLPSTATDICRWDSNHIGVTLPLQKQLRVIGNLSKTVRSISLREPYVRVCKMGEGEIVCYCDKPSQLDILAINYYNQVEVIKTINIPVFVKSLSIDKKTEKLLIVTKEKAFQYNSRIGGGGGHGSRQMVPSVLMSQVKRPLNLQGGSIDQTFVYLIDRSRMFAINDHNLLVNDLVTNNQLNYYIDLVDIFSRNISVSEMLSSTLYLQDLTVSDKARHIPLPKHLGDKGPVWIRSLVLTENNLIAGCDLRNGKIKIFTLDGQLLDSIKVNIYRNIKMCQWQSNTLVITSWDDEDLDKNQLLTLKVEFPLSLVIYQMRNNYKCVASLSNNQLVFSTLGDVGHLYFVDIDEIHSSVKEIKQIDIPEPLIRRGKDGNYSDEIHDIKVTAEDVIIVFNWRFIIFFNSGGQYLHSVRHYMRYFSNDRMTIDDSFLYIYGDWEKCLGASGYQNILCLTQNGEYKRIFLNKRIYKDKVYFPSIDCKGPRFVGSPRREERNELYVEGLFMVNRDSFPVARLQTDECPVQVKDFDVSEEGKTVVCEKANNGNVKIFNEDGQLLCHRNVASLVGGVCFTQESHIMATVPKRKEIFQLNGEDLQTTQVWSSLIPYGVLWRKVGNIYWCVRIELIECHCIKIDGDQVNILESVSLSNLDSGLRFPSITSETNKEIFSNESINKLEYRGGDGGGRRRGKSGEIIGKGRLKVRCGNYIAEINNSGIDEISVRRLPYRTAMVPFSIPAFEEPVDYNLWDIRDRNSKLIKLDENVSVLMFRESVTLIRTTTTTTVDILQHEQQQRPPLDICRWTEECFIVAFGREMRVFNRDLCRLKTIRTEKYYNRIYKYDDNQLVCGGHYIRDITQEERDKKYQRIWENNKDYYHCIDPNIFDPYYVDVVDIKDGKCKDEVCRGKMGRLGRFTMEDQTENTLRKLIPQKRALSYSTPKWDEEGVDNKRGKYERDDGSRREISEKRASSQPTTKQKRHKGDPKNWEIMGRRNILDKHIFYTRFNAYEDKIDLLKNSRKEISVTTTENKSEVHILLINEDKVDITERISLGHHNVSIAATPINFVVVDGSENKMVFYSTCGEELFQKYLPFYGYPHHIYSDNVYFYVLFRRHSILRCYDLYGEMKWQWELPFPVHPHIAVFQGTLYVPDTQLNRVLLYKYQDRSSGCRLSTKNPYIRNLNLRLKEKENDQKLVIGEICNLSNGQLVVSDINHDCLLYISQEGDIVSRLSLPSTATDICRWDSNHIGVTLPLQKQLRVIGNLSKRVRSISLRQPYVRVCKMGECEIVCYCDNPSHLEILAINYYNQVEVIKTINIPVFVKSLSIEKKTEKLLIVTRGKAFQYNTRIGGGGGGHGSRQMVPSVLMSQVKRPLNLQGGSIDQTSVYLIDRSRMFAINDHNLLVNDLVTNNQLNYYIDLVDVFSRNISVSEMLSSTLYLQDLTVSDKARHIPLPKHLGDKGPVWIRSLVLTENNLIAGCDLRNGKIKIFTLDGQLLDSIKVNVYRDIKMCQWQSNTLVITSWDDEDDKPQLLTLKVEFPLSLVIYQTRNNYKCVASLSNNQLVLSEEGDGRHLHFVDIDEIHSSLKEIKQIDIPEPLIEREEDGNYSDIIQDIKVTDEDVIIVFNWRFIIFFNSDGQYLHAVRHYMLYFSNDRMTIDDSFLYIYGDWEKCIGSSGYQNILCLTQNGEYKRIFLNKRIYKDKVYFSSIDCKGPRFVGSPRREERNELYVEGLFMVNRDSFPVARLQTDECPVQVKDFDVSEEGKTVVCEKANNGNVKLFDEDGQLLCHRNIASLVGGVCFTQESHIIATVPKRKEIFQLNGEDLQTAQVWSSLIPYGVIWRKVAGIYWCVHNELIECHCIKIDGDQVNILESVSLLNLDSGLRFPSITSETNKEIFSNELINNLEYRGRDGDGGRRRGKSGEIIGKGGLKVRCGNYIAEINNSGIDEILVRRLPYRTAMVPFSIPAFKEPVDYDLRDIRDRNSKLIKLDENVSVLMFRESVTLIRTTTTTVDILQHEQQQRPPLDICQWTEECFIVAFGEELMFFNRDLCRLKTIKTEKFYNRIYKYNDSQLVCGGHYIRDITQEERDKKYVRMWENNKDYYHCIDPDIFDPYYVDVVDIKDGKCKDEVCHGKMGRLGRLEGDEGVVDGVGVTTFGDVVVLRREKKEKVEWFEWWDVFCFVEWFREKSLVRRIRIEGGIIFGQEYYIPRPRQTIIGECVYITDFRNNIYEIPRHIEEETSEDDEILRSKDNPKYLLLRKDDNEVFEVLSLDVSDNSLMVFGIIPGRQSFAFFYFDK
ncbi:Hypothetical predicted protein [Octopus vulgaris]|uniref:Uncharacterized protein n=1 Tax=Octopus vulgaris TaxID=6645 RepID=A0AA36FR22_OCTVU|nr:Hypothetical predicted protein [Octopus vulgaris]